MTATQIEKINLCYRQYGEIIKPLVAEIEAQCEKLPLQLLNEIRAFNDHIARCHYGNPDSTYIDTQIDKAQRHITRITLDCFKALNVILFEQITKYEHQTRHIDLTVINSGQFFPEFTRLKKKAAQFVYDAKRKEATDIDAALFLYQDAYNKYREVTSLIADNRDTTQWAKVKTYSHKGVTALLWIISVILSALVSMYLSCEGFTKIKSLLP